MKVKRHTPKQNDTLPSRKEWEASGFAVPDDLCSDTPKAKVALAPVGSIAEAQAEMLGVKCPPSPAQVAELVAALRECESEIAMMRGTMDEAEWKEFAGWARVWETVKAALRNANAP